MSSENYVLSTMKNSCHLLTFTLILCSFWLVTQNNFPWYKFCHNSNKNETGRRENVYATRWEYFWYWLFNMPFIHSEHVLQIMKEKNIKGMLECIAEHFMIYVLVVYNFLKNRFHIYNTTHMLHIVGVTYRLFFFFTTVSCDIFLLSRKQKI